MGTVVKAFDPVANRHVALKVLSREATQLDALRFQREIAIQANIRHPHILPIHDSGYVGRTRFCAMELLHDPLDLEQLIHAWRSGALEARAGSEAVRSLEGILRHIILPICQAVHHANVREGVLHRDIKPANVMVDPDAWRPYLIDFGVAALLRQDNPRLQGIDESFPVPLRGDGVHVTGTLVYMPPEQARGEAHPRGDVWGLGALLHTLVTGEPPLEPAVRARVAPEVRRQNLEILRDAAREAGDAEEAVGYERMLRDLAEGKERTLEALRRDVLRGRYRPRPPGISRGLDAIISRAMHPDPEQRYTDAAAFARDLEAWLERRPVGAVLETSSAAREVVYRGRLFARRHRWRLAVLVAGVGVAAVGLAMLLAREPLPDPEHLAATARSEAALALAAGDLDAAWARALVALAHRPEAPANLALLRDIEHRRAFLQGLAAVEALRREAEGAADPGQREAGLAWAARRLDDVVGRDAALVPAGLDAADRVARLRAALDPRFPVVLEDLPPGVQVDAVPWSLDDGAVAWATPRRLAPGEEASPGVRLARGGWVLRFARDGRSVHVPMEVPDRPPEPVVVRCPVDPGTLAVGQTWVEGGTLRSGPYAGTVVPTLIWDLHEVTQEAYGAWLATLPADEAVRRAPRLAGDLGMPGALLWAVGEDGRPRPGAGAGLRPVEGISVRDATLHAEADGSRLPSAAEWMWAAVGAGPAVTPVGPLRALDAAGAHVDRALVGPRDVLSAPLDRSLFGLQDMAGNLAEMTSTFGRFQGVSGWWILGGSYREGPAATLAARPRVVAGWQPLDGVGYRRVRPPAAR
jgi:serine/threonine protein kinase/formylglycine-generating enzyme required for sulfatase activity